MPPLIPFIIAVLISAIGNLLLKFGVSKIGTITLAKATILSEVFKIFTSPYIVIGLSGYVLGFFVCI